MELADDRNPRKAGFLSNLGGSHARRFESLGELADLEASVVHSQQAVALTKDGNPNKPVYLNSLGLSYQCRFERLGRLADIEASIALTQQAVGLTNPSKPARLNTLGEAYTCRFERLGELADIDASLVHLRRAVELTPNGNPTKAVILNNLGNSHIRRFEHLGELADLQESLVCNQKAVEFTEDGSPRQVMNLNSLGWAHIRRFERLGELVDIEASLAYHQRVVELTKDESPFKAAYLNNLGNAYKCRFDLLGELADTGASLAHTQRALVLTEDGSPTKAVYSYNIGSIYMQRFQATGIAEDLEMAINSFKFAAQIPTAYPSYALIAARRWGDIAHKNGNLTCALEGYRLASEILPKVVWIGLSQTSRHAILSKEQSEGIACSSAACAIDLGEFETAVELLDSGRSYYWQQSSALRQDLEGVRDVNADLASALENIGQLLEKRSGEGLRFNTMDAIPSTTENIGRQRRDLAKSWEDTLGKIRLLPGFGDFLRPSPFHTLRRAASAGQVVIINVSSHRADALIVDAWQPLQHIPLLNIDLNTITLLSNRVTRKRPPANGSAAEDGYYVSRHLVPVLRRVWNDIVVPIFQLLGIPLTFDQSQGLQQRRIWWYLTGPLTFIPIHAAGPYEGPDSVDVSQLVISSYTTTLVSLVEAQKKNGTSS